MEPVTIILNLTLMVDEENDEMLESKLNDPHTAFDIPAGYIVDNIQVVPVDSELVKA